MPTSDLGSCRDGRGAVAQLERRLRDHYGMRYALCVSSATTGLAGVCKAIELAGEEFLTTPYTYGGSIAALLDRGNQPVFADIDPHTLSLDPESARARCTPSIRALLAVDIYGIPSDSAALRRVCDDLGIWYIADAAQAFGARRDGLPASAQADAVVLSFTQGKQLDAGEGGAVLTNHTTLYERLIWHTQHPDRQKRELGLLLVNEFAINGRIHPVAAQTAVSHFDTALARVEERRRKTQKLLDELESTELIAAECNGQDDIKPSYFRVVPAWRRGPAPAELQGLFPGLLVQPAPVRLLPEQAAFRAQFPTWSRHQLPCPQAHLQQRLRFCVVTPDAEGPMTNGQGWRTSS